MRLAMAYRAEFHDDIVVDLIGYRRHGHNEGDDPAYTQPRLYQRVRAHPTVFTLYAEALVKAGVVTADEVEAARSATTDRLRQALVAASAAKPSSGAGKAGTGSSKPSAEDAAGSNADVAADVAAEGDGDSTEAWDRDTRATAVAFAALTEINAASTAVPDGFSINRKLRRQLDRSRSDFSDESSLDWAHAEVLALGSLLRDGIPIRFSGQDAQRGTFSHRHLVFHDAGDRLGARAAGGHGRRPLRDPQLAAVGDRGAGLRVRLQRRRGPRSGHLGSAVRRLRQRGPARHRPVRRVGTGQVGTAFAARDAPAARLRR